MSEQRAGDEMQDPAYALLLGEVMQAAVTGRGAQMLEEVKRLGGWGAVVATWHTMGGRAAAFADVWEMMQWLEQDAELLADRFSTSVEEVRMLASRIHMLCVTGRAAQAEAELAQVSAELGASYRRLGEESTDETAIELAVSWEGWAQRFAQARLAL